MREENDRGEEEAKHAGVEKRNGENSREDGAEGSEQSKMYRVKDKENRRRKEKMRTYGPT